MNEGSGLTKQDLIDMATGLKADLRADMSEVAAGLRAEMRDVESRLRLHVSEECEKVETRLLAEFWKGGRSADQKMRRVEYSDASTVERLAILEDRVFTLERKAAGSKE